jgi:hypothetical protein
MGKFFINTVVLVTVGLVILSSCKKEEKPEEKTTKTTTQAPYSGDFKWTPTGSVTVTADSAFYYFSIYTIYAYKGGMSNTIEITLPDFGLSSYSVMPSQGQTFQYVSNSKTYNATSGAINITANTGTTVSGNFSVNINSGTVTSVTGQFSGIQRR